MVTKLLTVLKGSNRRGLFHVGLVLIVIAVLSASCGYSVVRAPVEDEMSVTVVAAPGITYEHPVRLSAPELKAILQSVRVQFKTNWLQRLLTGQLEPLPLFEPAQLTRVVPALAKALAEAGSHHRVVFYWAERRSDIHRDVTSGTLFVQGNLLHIVLANYRNGVDVVPGVPEYDRQHPEVAITPQRFSLAFDSHEFIVEGRRPPGLFPDGAPFLKVDYILFLNQLTQEQSTSSSSRLLGF